MMMMTMTTVDMRCWCCYCALYT